MQSTTDKTEDVLSEFLKKISNEDADQLKEQLYDLIQFFVKFKVYKPNNNLEEEFKEYCVNHSYDQILGIIRVLDNCDDYVFLKEKLYVAIRLIILKAIKVEEYAIHDESNHISSYVPTVMYLCSRYLIKFFGAIPVFFEERNHEEEKSMDGLALSSLIGAYYYVLILCRWCVIFPTFIG